MEISTLFFSAINKTSRQKISKDIEVHNSLYQLYLTAIYNTLHPARGKHMAFISAQGIFTQLDSILAHKTKLKKSLLKVWF